MGNVMGVARRCLAVLAIALVASCVGSNDTTTTEIPAATDGVSVTVGEPDVTEVPQATPVTPPPDSGPPDSRPPTELSDLEGLDVITVTTPPTGNGERPLLSWNPVDGAERYALTLSLPDGAAYFSWTGTPVSVWLGGTVDQPPADAAGPILVTELVLRVVAFDNTGAITAASAPTTIAP